ncbi:twin-arginine translocase TatA/TatE family subunit [Patulibacter sp.]|uniref:twin-arginine translocase TatA/TatE family subunit n=1 Tax=Patulibacter sp. TaxID=1912859 RepID=UPI00271814BE|nr:twin-arginine translocase TatA/TatE family subunit [Patulibacter sp.]MDO9410158.1 twin-arginine translocase TatA/TatE family subunit [Patulibacter sp.]
MPLALITPVTAVIVLAVVLLVLGPKRLTGVGKALGSNIRDFQKSVTSGDDDKKDLPSAQHADGTEAVTGEPVDEPRRTPRA